jgi:hypothetical protein
MPSKFASHSAHSSGARFITSLRLLIRISPIVVQTATSILPLLLIGRTPIWPAAEFANVEIVNFFYDLPGIVKDSDSDLSPEDLDEYVPAQSGWIMDSLEYAHKQYKQKISGDDPEETDVDDSTTA